MISVILVALWALAAPALGAEEIPPAPLVLDITASAPRAAYKNHVKRQLVQEPLLAENVAVLTGAFFDRDYLVDVTVGNQSFTLMLDTGSSDTWIIKEGFQCLNDTSSPVDSAECRFGSSGYNPSKSDTFVPLPHRYLDTVYGSGDSVKGTVGFEQITIGGLTVKHQEFTLVDQATFRSDHVSSGLLGLAYPNDTSVYIDSEFRASTDWNDGPEVYNSFFFSALAEGAVSAPYFSLAINRGNWSMMENSTYDRPLGHIAFGGMAPVDVKDNSVTVPVRKSKVPGDVGTLSWKYQYGLYHIAIDAYVFGNWSTPLPAVNTDAILDSGATFNKVPKDVAVAYHALWVPPAVYEDGTYFVACNGTAPPFSVRIGGRDFAVDSRDHVVPLGTFANGTERCISGTQAGGPSGDFSQYILGDTFLHNVVTTFRVSTAVDADNQITLTERATY